MNQQKLTNPFYVLLSLPSTAMGFALSVQMAALSWIMRNQYDLSIKDVGIVAMAGPLAGLLAQPIVGLISWYAWRSLPQVTLDAGELDGARGWSSFLRLGWPQRRLAVGVAMLAAVAIGCGDLSATILVTPPGLFTVSSRVFGLLHAGVDDQTAGLCLTLWCLFLSFTGLIAWGTAHANKPH